MATPTDIVQMLKEIRGDWKEINTELRAIIRETTGAITLANSKTEKPLWKTATFYGTILPWIVVFTLSAMALSGGGCVGIKDYVVIGNCPGQPAVEVGENSGS